MIYLVDIYSYYVYHEIEYSVTVLAMARTEQQIIKFAKQISTDKEFSRYFGYCHNVAVYKTTDLVPPYKFIGMKIWKTFSALLK